MCFQNSMGVICLSWKPVLYFVIIQTFFIVHFKTNSCDGEHGYIRNVH
jgi:hypothetical protein